MFSSSAPVGGSSNPVASFEYRQTTRPSPVSADDLPDSPQEPEVRLTERRLAELLAAERAAGSIDAEARMRRGFNERVEHQTERITKAIANFEQEQREYFGRVEGEVVQLALAIAGKILHREAQVDPMLVAAIVHLALSQLKDGSSASVRVRPEQTEKWNRHVASLSANLAIRVVADAELESGDCVLETELGIVNFSLDAQLKEVERGFFDVLAQKPRV